MPTPKTATLLIDCPDRKGIVVAIVNFLVGSNWRHQVSHFRSSSGL